MKFVSFTILFFVCACGGAKKTLQQSGGGHGSDTSTSTTTNTDTSAPLHHNFSGSVTLSATLSSPCYPQNLGCTAPPITITSDGSSVSIPTRTYTCSNPSPFLYTTVTRPALDLSVSEGQLLDNGVSVGTIYSDSLDFSDANAHLSLSNNSISEAWSDGSSSTGTCQYSLSGSVTYAVPSLGISYPTQGATYLVGVGIAPNTPASYGETPVSYAIDPALPAGLSMDPTTGAISGTPSATSSSNDYTITATEPDGSLSTSRISIAVVGFSYSPSAYSTQECVGFFNLPTPTYVASGATFTVSPSLPAQLTLNSSSGTITPTGIMPVSLPTTTYTITQSTSNFMSSTQLSLTVTPCPLSYSWNGGIPSANLKVLWPAGSPGIPLNLTPSGNYEKATTYSLQPAMLAAGLNFDSSTGIVSGAPSAPFPSTDYVVTATYASGLTATANLTLDVQPFTYSAGLNSKTQASSPFSAHVGDFVAINPTFQFGTFTITPSLPAGLMMGFEGGVIYGHPTGTSSATYTVTMSAYMGSVSTQFSLTILP